MTFQPSIILIFSTEMQPIYSKVSLNLDCNFQAIDSQHGRHPVLTETLMCEARTGSREMRLIVDKQNNALPHIYTLIDLNQTDPSWVLAPAGMSRKPSASCIIDQRETRFMP